MTRGFLYATTFAQRVGFLVLLGILITQRGWSDTVYQTSAAVLSNGADIQDCPSCPGGTKVGHIGGDDNGSVTFPAIVAPKSGLYPMTVYFTVSDDRSFDISVNHEPFPRSVIFRKRSRHGDLTHQTVLIPLNAGTNTITFENWREYGPELAQISISSAPVQSHRISGLVRDGAGNPLAGVKVRLSGSIDTETTTDGAGAYEFNYLPDGDYRIAPHSPGKMLAPNDRFFAAITDDKNGENFVAQAFRPKPPKPYVMEAGRWRIAYDLANGTADIFADDKPLFNGIHAEVQLPQTVTSMDFESRTITHRRIRDKFGSGKKFRVESTGSNIGKLIQTFWLYDKADYFLTSVAVERKQEASTRFMAPFVLDVPANILPAGDNRALFVPFDNDKWIRYDARPFGGTFTSYEASAFFNATTRRGLVVGSIDHDTWKTGIESVTAGNQIDQLKVFGGVTSVATRDVLPHGEVRGELVQSPRIFVGLFDDWRTGLQTFARANTSVARPRPWSGGVPFGWNSWGKLQTNVSYAKAIEVSDFFARELQPHHFENRGIVYIGLDAGWGRFSDEELTKFVQHCKANHQEAGIYFTPFADFGRKPYAKVEGADCQYEDIYLYAKGDRQRIAGGVALDPTHPGTRARMRYEIERFKRFGFKYIKADFLVHGALEGSHFYDPHVTTGLQAYNSGMKYLNELMGPKMYLNLAISPVCPAQYADSRRIACDSWGDIGKVEYTLNALTYGWWLGSVYDFNDPDHVVLGGYSDGENRARVTSAILTGLCISGDDFSKDGDPKGKDKARRFLTNADIDALGRSRKPFRPVEGNTGNHASPLFVCEDRKCFYLAALNYSATAATNMVVDFARIGLKTEGPMYAKELWSGRVATESSPMTIHIRPADAVVYRFYKDGQRPK
jgi:alpha-galactosidase